jgi:uncharacterized protein (UPF0332 family)
MTLQNEERLEMSKLYIEKAREAIQEAKVNEAHFPNLSVVRAYYSMFYAAQSALVVRGIEGLRRHEGVNSKFGQIFVKEGKFPKEIFTLMGQAETNRYAADYNLKVKFSSLDAKIHIENAERFVDAVEKMLLC